jgi:hypothetical protein
LQGYQLSRSGLATFRTAPALVAVSVEAVGYGAVSAADAHSEINLPAVLRLENRAVCACRLAVGKRFKV